VSIVLLVHPNAEAWLSSRPDIAATVTPAATARDARAYLAHTPYFVLDGQVPERDAFVLAQDKGLSIVETPFKGPKAQADELIQNIINRFESLIQSA